MTVCYQKGRERGIWFEIKCLKDVIKNKEGRGEDASFGKQILKSFLKYSETDYSHRAFSPM